MFTSLVGKTLGKYHLHELLGSGFMGAVYRGYDPVLGREVAIKVINTTLGRPDFQTRFFREAKTAASLDHSHIVHIYDYGVDNETTYVVMQHLTGGSLSHRMMQAIAQRRSLPSLPEAARLLSQLAKALDYAHQQKIIHRDIKPANIMLNSHGEAIIVDFGIAKLIDSTTHLTNANVTVGTPNFMPPEQWTKVALTPAADQYALAVSLYQILTGTLPFDGEGLPELWHKIQHTLPRALHDCRPDATFEVTTVLEQAMAKRPQNRFDTCTAFAEAFRLAVGDTPMMETVFFTFKLKPMTLVPSSPIANTGYAALHKQPAEKKAQTAITLPVDTPKRRSRGMGLMMATMLAIAIFSGGNLLLAPQFPKAVGSAPTSPAQLIGQQKILYTDTQTTSPTSTVTASATHSPTASPTPTPTSTWTPQPSKTATKTTSPTARATIKPSETAHLIVNLPIIPTLNPRQAAQATLTAVAQPLEPTTDYQMAVEGELTAIFQELLTATATQWTATPSPTASLTSTARPTMTPTRVLLNVVRSANLREGPGTTYKVVGAAHENDDFEIIAQWWGWYLIDRGDGRRAWIADIVVELPDPTPEIEMARTIPASPIPTHTPTFTPSPTLTETPTVFIIPPEVTNRP